MSISHTNKNASESELHRITQAIVRNRTLFQVLLVAHLLQPFNRLAVQPLLNSNVRHRRLRRCPMPMFLSRLKPDHIAGVDLFNRTIPTLHPSTPAGHNQSLAQRMRMPRRPRAWLKGYMGTTNAGRLWGGEKWVHPHRAREVF